PPTHTRSLHDALPIYAVFSISANSPALVGGHGGGGGGGGGSGSGGQGGGGGGGGASGPSGGGGGGVGAPDCTDTESPFEFWPGEDRKSTRLNSSHVKI